jgi:hypothetical protein
MKRMRRSLLPLVLLLALLAPTPSGGAEDLRPVYELLKKPSAAAIESFLKGGVKWGWGMGNGSFGVAIAWNGLLSWDSPGIPSGQCEGTEPVVVTYGSIEGSCAETLTAYGTEGIETVPKGTSKTTISVELVSDELMVIQDRTYGRTVVRHCSDECAVSGPDTLFLEIIPGARNRALFDSTLAFLRKAKLEALRVPVLVFEGPDAKKARVETEIFFAEGRPDAKDLAEKVARELEPIVGVVSVKQWPGKWDYPVVVVVGERKAAKK